ncbi:MAG: hypothetical protein GXN92_00320 [Candidatus Micrarchaeota archaeon]|nr:hypothetical protein [Candidatus Micrarchaeota archaeon]
MVRQVSWLYLVGAAFGIAAGEKEMATLFGGLGVLGLASTTHPRALKAWLAQRRNSFARHKLGPDRW